MKLLAKLAVAALVSASFVTGGAQAANLKEAKDVRIAFVVHGSASDPYWSVVKRGVDDAAALTGATVEYHSPQVFDVIEQALANLVVLDGQESAQQAKTLFQVELRRRAISSFRFR